METLARLGYDRTGRTSAALLNWLLKFNLDNEKHIHHMVLMKQGAKTSEPRTLHFCCYTCFINCNLNVLKSERADDFTCIKASTHHLHVRIAPDEPESSKTVVEIRCCLCEYHAELNFRRPLIPKRIMDDFIASFASTKLAIDALSTICTQVCAPSGREELDNPDIIDILQAENGVQVD
jgi:hypothetical protein